MRNRTQLRPIPLGIIIQLEQRHSQEFHILRHAQNFPRGELDKVEFLAFSGSCDVRGEVGVHESFEVRAVPLRQCVGDVPVGVGGVVGGEGAGGGEAFVQAGFEGGDFGGVVGEIVAGSGVLTSAHLAT